MVELAAETGELGPRPFAWETTGDAPPTLDHLSFTRLSVGPVRHRAKDPSDGLPEPWASRSFASLPLRVTPPFAPVDTLLILVGEGSESEPGALEQTRSELEARLSERRQVVLARLLLRAIEQAADPVELSDRHARLFYVNPAWEERFGYSAREATGRYVAELLRDTIKPLHDRSFYQFTLAKLASGQSWLGALMSLNRDGSVRINEVSVSPFDAPAQGFSGNIAIRRDVAHRAERDAALSAAHGEFRAVLAAIPDGVTVLRDDRVYFVNPAFLRMVDSSEAGVIGRPFLEFVHEDDRATFERGNASGATHVRIRRASGGPRFAEISPAGAISFEGRPAIILISRDVTDRRVAEEQLARAERLSALGELAAGVAHELNNPMAYVVMNLEVARTKLAESADAETLDSLDEALDGARRMQQITAELRSFSGSDNAGPPGPVDVKAAVISAINIALNQIRHRAKLVRDLGEELFVVAREGQLVQILVNLLANAGQAIPEDNDPNHTVTVRSRALGPGSVEISVTDTGAGIPADLMPRLFDPFSTTKPRGQGSGLGLAITRKLVSQFGGQVRAENAPERGTVVTVTLERVLTRPTETGPDPRLAARAPRSGLDVLVVDDEASIGKALKRVLSGHNVMTTTDAAEALTLLAERDFDVVLCDLMMPGTSGALLYATACKDRPALKDRFVFISGGTFSEEGARFLEQSHLRVLPKPFSNSDVLHVVEEIATARDGEPPLTSSAKTTRE